MKETSKVKQLQSALKGHCPVVLLDKESNCSFTLFLLLNSVSQASEVVVISNDTTLRTGDTAVLACMGFGEPDVEISWSFNGATVVNTSLITIYQENVVQGERLFKQSILQICNLSESDAGGYTCIASDGFTTANTTTQLTVTS